MSRKNEAYIIKDENEIMSCSECGHKPLSVLPINKTHHACGKCYVMLSIAKSIEMNKRSDEDSKT